MPESSVPPHIQGNKKLNNTNKPAPSVRFIVALNKLFPKVPHPFNINSDSKFGYSEWEFERGSQAIGKYSPSYTAEDILSGKDVLDCGCGGGGKTVYYASNGAKSVTGLDINDKDLASAAEFAELKSVSERTRFVLGSACDMPFPDSSFDSVIMNDFFEHVGDPLSALKESMRVLRDGGRLYINFPPYHHPWGAHLSDAINIPWVHLFFSEKHLIEAYSILVSKYPDSNYRINLRTGGCKDRLGYINHMSIKKARDIIKKYGFIPEYHKKLPLKRLLKPLIMFESFTGTVVYVFKKEQKSIL